MDVWFQRVCGHEGCEVFRGCQGSGEVKILPFLKTLQTKFFTLGSILCLVDPPSHVATCKSPMFWIV